MYSDSVYTSLKITRSQFAGKFKVLETGEEIPFSTVFTTDNSESTIVSGGQLQSMLFLLPPPHLHYVFPVSGN